jgi:putative membrane protein
VDTPSLLTSWTLDPLQLLPLALIAFMYGRRARTLAARGTPVPRWRVACFYGGIAIVFIALASPLHAIGESELFAFHMTQHVLIGDLAPLALLCGLTGPMLRPVLAIRVVDRLRFLAHPLVALPIWATNLYVWHLPFLYEGAVRNDALHAVEHVSFLTAGALMWAPVVEVLPAPEWFGTGMKIGYIVSVRLLETVLGNVFLWTTTVLYPVYDRPPALWGISPLADQGIAGGVMMTEGSIVTLLALAWLFLRMAREGELRQELLEEGHEPRAVRRAVRYGRAEDLRTAR